MPDSTAEMLKRSVASPDAFGGFYDVFFRELLTYLTRRTGDPEAGFDLAAETFAQAFEARTRFRGETHSEAASWIYTIAKRQLAGYIRYGYARMQALERLGIERREIDEQASEEIERIAQLDELRAYLRPRLAELTPERREAVGLRVLEGRPFHEVARRLGVSEQAARARVSRALRQMGESLETPVVPKEATT